MNKLKTAVYIIPILVFMFLLASCKNPTPSATWVVSTLAGSTEGFNNGSGTAAQFNYPTGVAVDSSGNVCVADTDNHLIRKITSAGVVSTLAGGYFGIKDGTAAQFRYPTGVAVDSSGNVYVADWGNHRVRKIEYRMP